MPVALVQVDLYAP